jgi:hypothetical protein
VAAGSFSIFTLDDKGLSSSMAGVETGTLMPEMLVLKIFDNLRASMGGFIEAIVDVSVVVEVAKKW